MPPRDCLDHDVAGVPRRRRDRRCCRPRRARDRDGLRIRGRSRPSHVEQRRYPRRPAVADAAGNPGFQRRGGRCVGVRQAPSSSLRRQWTWRRGRRWHTVPHWRRSVRRGDHRPRGATIPARAGSIDVGSCRRCSASPPRRSSACCCLSAGAAPQVEPAVTTADEPAPPTPVGWRCLRRRTRRRLVRKVVGRPVLRFSSAGTRATEPAQTYRPSRPISPSPTVRAPVQAVPRLPAVDAGSGTNPCRPAPAPLVGGPRGVARRGTCTRSVPTGRRTFRSANPPGPRHDRSAECVHCASLNAYGRRRDAGIAGRPRP